MDKELSVQDLKEIVKGIDEQGLNEKDLEDLKIVKRKLSKSRHVENMEMRYNDPTIRQIVNGVITKRWL